MDANEKKPTGFSRCCESCGTKYDSDSVFCENCGAKLPSVSKRFWELCKSVFGFCKRHKWIVLIAGGLLSFLSVIAIIAVIILNIPHNIDFTDYVITTVSGYNGYGKITAVLDYEALSEKVLGEMPDPNKKKEYEDYLKYMSDVSLLENSVYVRIEYDDSVKNGDFCLVTIYVTDATLFEEYGFDIDDKNQTVTLEIGEDTPAFKEPITIDLFEKIQVTFEGENGIGEANIDNKEFEFVVTDSEGKNITITARYASSLWGYDSFEIRSSESDGYISLQVELSDARALNNGDVVTLTLSKNALLLELLGVELSSYEKEYTVSGLE